MIRLTRPTLKTEIVAGARAIAGLAEEWRDIERRSGPAGVFEGFGMVSLAAQAAEAAGSEPVVVIARAGCGSARTLLPLRLVRSFGARVAQALTAPLGQYCDVAGEPLRPWQLAVLCRDLHARLGLDLIILRRVRSDARLAEALAVHGLAQNEATSAPFIDLAAFGSFEAYAATFSATTRRNRRQRRDRLEARHGPLAFSVLRGAEAARLLDTAIAWKARWLADRGLKSAVLDEGPWQEALRRTVTLGHAVVSVLSAGGRPVAIEHGFLSHDTYSSYLGAFDPVLASLSVGQEQMLRTIAWAFEQGVARYDLMAPGDAYKRQWARTRRNAVDVEDYAVPLTALGRGIAEVRRHARPAAKSLVLNLHPELRVAGARYGKPAALAAAALGLAALAAE